MTNDIKEIFDIIMMNTVLFGTIILVSKMIEKGFQDYMDYMCDEFYPIESTK